MDLMIYLIGDKQGEKKTLDRVQITEKYMELCSSSPGVNNNNANQKHPRKMTSKREVLLMRM